jgi:exopolysaccharide biosynthesis polyprenyl glycosylphosphotransferase
VIGFSLPLRSEMYRKISAFMTRAAGGATARPVKTATLESTRSVTFEKTQVAAATLLPEKVFRKALCQERKRSERSRRNFILMLVRKRPRIDSHAESQAVMSQAARMLSRVMRETDALGWFEFPSIVGGIFTELGNVEITAAIESIQSKASAALQNVLDKSGLGNFEISFQAFPDGRNSSCDDDRDFNEVFYPDLTARKERKLAFLVKRVMDIVGSSIALIVLSPIFLALAILIKLTSEGPVFFRQERVGQFEKPFVFLKFRSMYVSTDSEIHKEYVRKFIAGRAGSNGGDGRQPIYKITNDPRVTWIGRFMRRTSLDELPQFWNVLVGQMSLVGPRPPIRYEIEAYDLWHRRRLREAKPGITGLWQVQGRSKTTFDDMVRLDLHYCKTWSPLRDLKILLQTPRAVFSGDGAY